MASKQLNPAAAEFIPGSFKSDTSNWGSLCEVSEDHVTPEELEATEEWVLRLAELEEEEEDHLVAVALRYAPESKVNEIRKQCGVKSAKLRSHHKGIHSRGVTGAW